MNEKLKRNIDIALLRSLVGVANTGSMTAAAAQLNLTQAAISQQIKRLEELFEAQLFDRQHRQLKLTAKGERLLAFAKRMVQLNDETFNAIVAPEFEGVIRLGVPYDIVGFFMPKILSNFRKAWPQVEIQLGTDNSIFLLEAVDRGEIDIVLTTEPEARETVLLADRLVWIGKKGGDAWSQRPLPVSYGRETCTFRPSVIDALSQAGLDWKVISHLGSLETTYALLEADMYVTPLLSRTVPDGVERLTRDVQGLPNLPVFYINMICAKPANRLTEEMANFIRRGFAEMEKRAA